MSRRLRIDLFWLCLVLFLAPILYFILRTVFIHNSFTDYIQRAQILVIYYVFSPISFVFLIFILVTFGVFLIRQSISGFRFNSGNFILLGSILVLIFMISIGNPVLEFFFQFRQITSTEGWTIYPPLSAVPKAMPGSGKVYEVYFTTGFIQLILASFASFTAYRCGRNSFRVRDQNAIV